MTQQQIDPLATAAALDEANWLLDQARGRCTTLNVEVRRARTAAAAQKDRADAAEALVVELEQQLADLTAPGSEVPAR
ncbi:hypothetical protein [Nocardioides ochotonae]|uniref:hypothetical protein n=1 Tax=Nocardioides ochotonae TaxID=2685869 RepID=UPI001409241B|nr:hypothetical protein [Nocardioides ochotonae]